MWNETDFPHFFADVDVIVARGSRMMMAASSSDDSSEEGGETIPPRQDTGTFSKYRGLLATHRISKTEDVAHHQSLKKKKKSFENKEASKGM